MTANRKVNLIAGWVFVLLGIAGFILPILQGFLFLIVGLLFLSKEYQWAHRLVLWIKKKTEKYLPRAAKLFESSEKFLESEVRKMTADRTYFLKKMWLLLALIILLGLFSYLLSLLIGWLIHILRG